MKKLKLDLETVEVQSFDTTPEIEELLGTVHGAGITQSRCGGTCIASCCHTEDMAG